MGLTHGGNLYAIAREHGWDWRDILDFSASINPLGPSPNVMNAIGEAQDRIVHYPDRESFELRTALADTWGIERDRIIVGNGATELIYFMARVLEGKPVTVALPAFSEMHRAFPEASLADLSDPSTWPGQGVLIVTRPANPTGYMGSLRDLRDWSGPNRMLIVDESFLDFDGEAVSLAGAPHTVVLKSLTKFYALPGLRVGALITSEPWEALREPWQVNVLAEQAAVAAVRDTAHAERSRSFMATERAWLGAQLNAASGNANFVYVQLPHPAAALCEHLLQHKILARNCAGWPGVPGESVRIAVRTREENTILLRTWRTFPCA